MTHTLIRSQRRRTAHVSARNAAVLTATICLALTLVVLLADLDPTAGSRRLHAVLETAGATVLLFVAAVLVGRFLSDGSRRNLLMVTAVIVLAVKNLVFAVGIVLDNNIPNGDQTLIWATATSGMAGAALLAAAGLLPDRRARHARTAASVVGIGIAIVGSVLISAWAVEALLPTAFKDLPEDLEQLALLSAHPMKIVIDLVTATSYLVTAFAFARLADARDDEFMRWLAIGAMIATIAFVNYALYPSRYTDLLYGGEVLRIGAVAALLYGAVREISNLEAAYVRSAVLTERKRVARDLHDGVAQELAYISSQIHWMIGEPADREPLRKVLDSVERALDESRGAIASLNRPLDEPLDVALAHAAGDIADRVGARLRLDLEPNVEVTQDWRDTLLRIVREAVGNAVRHGHARTISVQLRNRGPVTLSIVDDGDGFDVNAQRSSQSFGLTGMRERTDSLGGRFSIKSAPQAGTAVQIEIP